MAEPNCVTLVCRGLLTWVIDLLLAATEYKVQF